ncbi:MAG: carboxylesterase/lipase family protein [Bryobacterales bacterium]|nr:carboxylesterase/lipase family protein [Bryobacterales bacterium]MBV9399930.1 carboxylesterase/lipase family protein [Bryobacterales bacterium]
MNRMNRRSFLGSASLAATALVKSTGADIKSSSSGPVVETTSGKIRGAAINKVNAFKGISYGDTTEGAARFMPPSKPKPWTGVKDTVDWGLEAPQGAHTEIPEVAATIPKQGHSEDCLRLNVWTNSVSRGGKRPVMLWLHGGGFTSGSGSYSIYDGANMARKHDVVTVTVNHRLNSFGFLYFPEIGASNAGMLDIVAALQWVRDNIANFGGDPNNVTIFGQSGGAGKVSTLLAMPSAKGLFHRAIIQSGANLQGISPADAKKTADTLMAKLNVKSPAELQKIPMDQLVEATLSTPGLRLGPVLDGKTLPEGPFTPAAPAMSADIPVIIGSTEFEVNFFPNTKFDPINDAGLHAAVKQATRAGDADVDKLIAIYRKGRAGYSNVELQQVIASDGFRAGVVTEAERKAAQKAPVYMYYFTWRSPVRDGKLKAFHTLEIPFVLENVDEGKSMTGTGQDRYALQEKMSGAWAAFARTGNPNHKGLPNWPAFTTDKRATMIFNNECKVANDPYGEERVAFAATRPAQA